MTTIEADTVIALLHELGIEDWENVHDLTITPPGTVVVTKYRRGPKGFLVNEARNDVLQDVIVAGIRWPEKKGADRVRVQS